MAANVNIVVNAQDRASGVLRKIRHAFGEIFQVALGVRLSHTLQRMGEAVRNFATSSIDAAAGLQQFTIGVETLIARETYLQATAVHAAEALMMPWQIAKEFTPDQLALADSVHEFGDALEYAQSVSAGYVSTLQEIALLSPYQFGDVQKAFRQAMAFGFTSKEAVKFTEATLNMAAGVGASNQQLDRMAYNLAQIRLQGKVTKLDIRQLALAGFDLRSVLQYVGESMGVAIDDHLDFNRAINQGKITWADFTRLYAEYADTYFGGASERMARTLFGLRNTFKDIFAVIMPQILGPTLDGITEFTSGVLDKILELRNSGVLEEWGAELKEKFDANWRPVLDYIMFGDFTSGNTFVTFLAAMKEVLSGEWLDEKPGGFSYLFETLTGFDAEPVLETLRLLKEVFTSAKEGEFLSDYNLENLDILAGFDAGTLESVRDTVFGIVGAIQGIATLGVTSPGGAALLANLFGVDPALLVGVITQLQLVWEPMKQDFINAWQYMGMAMQPIIDVFVNTLLPVWGLLAGLFAQIGLWLGPVVSGVFAEIAEFWAANSETFAGLIDLFLKFGAVLFTIVTAIIGFLAPVIEGLIGFLLGMFSALVAFLEGDLDTAWLYVKDAFADLILGVEEGVNNVGDFLMGIWDDHIKPALDEWIPKMLETGENLILSLAEGFVGAVETAKENLAIGLESMVGFIKNFLGISSPSEVFMEMGAASMAGFIKGFQPDQMINAGLNAGAVPSMRALGAGAGAGGRQIVINNHFHGLTLMDRLNAETQLRPIVEKIVR